MRIKYQNISRVFVLSIMASLFVSCRQMVVKVDKLPSNTPHGALIYITGNFNLWDPGDNAFQMTLQPDSTYLIKLPRSFGRIEYKFTRGNWSTVEQNKCGYAIGNHFISHATSDTITNQIESWADLDPVDCDSVTIVLDKVPEPTTPDSKIKIAGNFNAWNPGQKDEFVVKTNPVTQKKFVTISRKAVNKEAEKTEIQYLFVRDTIAVPEVDRFGREIGARTLQIDRGDTVNVSIENWKDNVDQAKYHVAIILTRIPETTPKNDFIYLVGNFNDWNPGDENYRFEKQKNGTYQISIPRLKYGLSFKITRGSWDTEFSDGCGNRFGNQDYNYDEVDTIRIAIDGWFDKVKKRSSEVVFIIDSLPKETPKDSKFYLTSGANGWNAGDERFAFELRSDGRYYLEKSRRLSLWDYKITRGSWVSQEVGANGQFIDNHWFNKDCVDTLLVKIIRWNDITLPGEPVTNIIIRKQPEKTDDKQDIYLVGAFNNWDPGDKQFILQKNKAGQYFIQVPSRWLQYGFKFTLGSWEKVELDRHGFDIENRVYKGTDKDLYLDIERWRK